MQDATNGSTTETEGSRTIIGLVVQDGYIRRVAPRCGAVPKCKVVDALNPDREIQLRHGEKLRYTMLGPKSNIIQMEGTYNVAGFLSAGPDRCFAINSMAPGSRLDSLDVDSDEAAQSVLAMSRQTITDHRVEDAAIQQPAEPPTQTVEDVHYPHAVPQPAGYGAPSMNRRVRMG